MPRATNPLTSVEVSNTPCPQTGTKKLFDGKVPGLYLELYANGSRLWRLKYRIEGKEKRVALGKYPSVSLKDAREAGTKLRASIADGIDPASIPSSAETTLFRTVAEQWFANQSSSWTPKTTRKYNYMVQNYILPNIGDLGIDKITPPIILGCCKKLLQEQVTVYVVSVVKSLISRIFRYGVASGVVESDPCRDIDYALPKHKHTHYATIVEPVEIGRLLLAIDGYPNVILRAALQLLALTMVRTGELRFATWNEISLDEQLWRIPAHRMKSRRDHLVPLSKQATTILVELKKITGGGQYVITGRDRTRPISDNTVNAGLRYLGYTNKQIVGHGFRAMASTLLNELQVNPDLIERQLAHAEKNAVRAAYNRAAYLDERRTMLQMWADYLDELKEKARR